MNFLQFVELVTLGASAEAVATSNIPEADPEEIGIYMVQKAGLTNELAFFDLEQVPPNIFITVNGIVYEAFFSPSELADMIPEYANFLGAAASPLVIAEAILHYHKYDA